MQYLFWSISILYVIDFSGGQGTNRPVNWGNEGNDDSDDDDDSSDWFAMSGPGRVFSSQTKYYPQYGH